MSQKGLRVEFTVPRPHKRQEETPAPKDPVPRIARLLALAHKWEGMVRRGDIKNYAEIASRYGLSRARVTQICSWTLLSPLMQDAILFPNRQPPRRVVITTPCLQSFRSGCRDLLWYPE